MTTYDSIPYPSYCYPQSSPAHLHAISKLFGLTPVDLDEAKVLEIGCASGGNLLPLATRFPKSEFVGIDLSKGQISKAKEHVKKLELENVKFIAASIVEHNFKREKFDYIIVHGVYSWVPTNVQGRLLEICGEHLSKNGVAFISYNTLPGWNAVKTIRDMMLYHGQNFKDPAQKVQQSRQMLKFVSENMKHQTGPYKETLDAEIKTLQDVSDNYLLHDHLEAVNAPCYFHEFIDKAAQQGLTYLSEADLPSMFLGNQNKTVSGVLSQIDDPIRLEQYLDFITNRRFRSTLLVKEGNQVLRHVSSERLEEIRFIPQYRLKDTLAIEDLGKIEELDLVHIRNESQTANVKGRVICTAIIEMLRALPHRLSLQDITKHAAEHLGDLTIDDIEKELGNVLLKFIFNGIFNITSDQSCVCTEITEKPFAFLPAILLGQSMDMLPNQHHEVVKLTDDQRLVLQYVNGRNTIEQICEVLKGHIDKGELNINANGKPLDKETAGFDGYIRQYVEQTLHLYAQNALLQA
ncbi:class I SAM-dependent methyltransferase [Terasakiella sp. SH-1]|uniref:class I SAM-dependent methyltransferase n=1 Tax=Terasakiella sp. SH-1 TaxID=2560057 RepID=UPI0010743711|nr:class I SAM-dependent methyltransferase [Terasakiella sp. SH-1]